MIWCPECSATEDEIVFGKGDHAECYVCNLKGHESLFDTNEDARTLYDALGRARKWLLAGDLKAAIDEVKDCNLAFSEGFCAIGKSE